MAVPPRRPVLALLTTLLAAAPAGAARTPAPSIRPLRCVPVHASRCTSGVVAPVGGQVQLRGAPLYRGMRVTFRWSAGAIATALRRTRAGWVARVPAGTHAGLVYVTVRDRHLRRSNRQRMRVSAPVVAVTPPATPVGPTSLPVPFQGSGMWIWELSKSNGGDPTSIAQRAQQAGMSTVFVKSGDGRNMWSQFNPTLVSELHDAGLHVCAWQFVYGTYPAGEAKVAAQAVTDGADCLVIDAESDYEGHYAAAQTYINDLRAAIGEDYPLALTSFPYVDYHPQLPYSVFLGPGGAQVNAPQVYWKTIGGTVDAVSAHSWRENRIYMAPVAPLGQSYDSPRAADVTRFRQLWAAYGAQGISWWSWQSTTAATWAVLAQPAPPTATVDDPGWPALKLKSKGDEVIWLQEHLSSADQSVAVDGTFGASTDTALRTFQTDHAIPATGVTDAATWQALLALPIHAVDWRTRSAPPATARAARAPEIPQLGRGG